LTRTLVFGSKEASPASEAGLVLLVRIDPWPPPRQRVAGQEAYLVDALNLLRR
jgi:hypothetical protein